MGCRCTLEGVPFVAVLRWWVGLGCWGWLQVVPIVSDLRFSGDIDHMGETEVWSWYPISEWNVDVYRLTILEI